MAAKINNRQIHNLIEEIKWFTAIIERHKQLEDDSQLDQYIAKRNKLYSALAIELVKVLSAFKSKKIASLLTQVIALLANEPADNLGPMPKELEVSLQELEAVV